MHDAQRCQALRSPFSYPPEFFISTHESAPDHTSLVLPLPDSPIVSIKET